jgi:hypothetical protein
MPTDRAAMIERFEEIEQRWLALAAVPIIRNLDYARLGERAKEDVPALLEIVRELIADRERLQRETQQNYAAIAEKQRRDEARIAELEAERDLLDHVARNMNRHIEELMDRNLAIARDLHAITAERDQNA